MHLRPQMFAFLFAVLLAPACATTEEADDGDVDVGTDRSGLTLSFTGTSTPKKTWFTFPFEAKVGDTIKASLDWDNANANLNVYLYSPEGVVVAYENSTTAKPSATSTVAKLGGTWKVAVKANGSAKFAIQLDVIPAIRFPGDPGAGKMYLGIATASQSATAYDSLESSLGKKFGMTRLYYADSIGWSNVDAHLAKGRLPAVSFKNGSRSMANIASGAEDAWIDGIGAEIARRAPKPLFMTFYHEPEDNFPSSSAAATFRAASRRIVSRWRAAGVKNFTYVSDYYMTNWSFNALSGRDWRWWYPDWKGTTTAGSSKDAPNAADFYSGADSVVDVIGFDVYNWWAPDGSGAWTTFKYQADFGTSRTKILGKPYCVGEMGTMAYASGGTYDAAKTKGWLTEAYGYMLENGFVCAMYWNNDHTQDAWDPRLERNDPQKLRIGALADIMGRPTTLLPSF